ncbi:THUMP-like domain-containing protein [Microscilla marina]|uniref:Uncharacterized protein n=1 Tax=Microscilla marina ATCC 23134 TaxID=313606 RepID=A1ZMW2_MICM2|nr:hypothetical protein [Microscilla marina]EAY28143.1 conserved hypothetical protein [Microscilla marina ATCC 23134]
MSDSDIAFLLSEDVQQYIDANLYKTPADLILAASPYSKPEMTHIVGQIQARRKIQAKLPTWFDTPNIIYPPLLSIEQCSSEIAALHKAQILSGNTLVDLTGGFGVDSYHFAQTFDQVYYVEQHQELAKLVQHNFEAFGVTNIQIKAQSAESFLKEVDKVDAVYIDPARRDDAKNKVFRLEECTPNLLELLPVLWQKTDQLLIKLSPMLDIDLGIRQLEQVAKVVVVAINNECKELLFVLKNNHQTIPHIEALNLNAHKPAQYFSFTRNEERTSQVVYAEPMQYLYEPNVAILKAGAFKQIAQCFGLAKLHPHSHLYTSNTWLKDFPGRSFKIKGVCRYTKKEVAKYCPAKKANITARNFPDSVALVRKKLQLKDGGNDYLFVTQTQAHRALVIVTEKA